jgi:transcription initiation factor TFIID subunit 12
MATPAMPMIRPQQIDSLPHLDASQKQTYKQGLMNLWNAFDNNPEGSQAKNDAKAKIQNASRKIMQQLGGGQRNPSNAAPQQAQQVQRPPQAQQAGAQGAQTQGVQQGAMQGQQNQQQMQQPQQQQQRPQQQQQMQQPQQQQQQGGQDQVAQLQAKVKQMVQNLVVFPEPTTANSQQFEQYKLTFQQGLGTSILKRERARQEQIRLEGLETQMKNSGQNLADEMVARLNGARAACAEAQRAVTALEQKNEQNKNLYNQKQARNKEMQQAGQQGQQVNGQQPMANQQVNGAQAQGMQRTNSQQTQGNVGQGDVKMEQQQQQSPAPPQFAQQQQQQQVQTPQVGTPVQQQQQMPPQQQQQQQARPQQQGTPQSATQPQQQFPQNNMQQQQQQRPPMNQQQSQQHQQYGVPQQQQQQQIPQQQQQQQPQQQYQQTPQSAMQQNNTPNQQQAPQQPHALTQRDAMARSAQSYTQQQQQQQGPNVNQPQQPMQQQHGNMPNGMPFNQPQSATQHTPTQTGFPPTQQMNSQNTKFPIPKDLRMDPRTQAPVAGPPSRPTMMGQGGMMNVPGVQKPAPFTLEGEGDHVLSKRKLDELVRQITGSVSPQDGLSPEVEEAVLSLTDNFVDNVIQKACALAKLRAGQTLEVKDIQMVLERNYGIRIPGYSLDELRTVRKFQPAPGWVGKVQAVQAGKVMGGNKDA